MCSTSALWLSVILSQENWQFKSTGISPLNARSSIRLSLYPLQKTPFGINTPIKSRDISKTMAKMYTASSESGTKISSAKTYSPSKSSSFGAKPIPSFTNTTITTTFLCNSTTSPSTIAKTCLPPTRGSDRIKEHSSIGWWSQRQKKSTGCKKSKEEERDRMKRTIPLIEWHGSRRQSCKAKTPTLPTRNTGERKSRGVGRIRQICSEGRVCRRSCSDCNSRYLILWLASNLFFIIKAFI